MKHRAVIAFLFMLIAVGLLLFAFPRPSHALAVTGIVLMIVGAAVAGLGLFLDRRVTSRRRSPW
jgi:drug/metabolite transporter (DMT)-like permease